MTTDGWVIVSGGSCDAPPAPATDNRWVVTGAGRSGTGFASAVLQAAGVRCGHEGVFRFRPPDPRSVSWDGFDADSSWIAVPYLDHRELFGRTVLLVRHPLAVVRSWAQLDLLGPRSVRHPGMVGRIVYGFRPEVRRERTQLDRCAAMWLHWNRVALPRTDAVVRHEELVADAAVLLGEFGVTAPVDAAEMGRVNGMDRDKRRQVPELGWGDLRPGLARQVRELAERLGGRPWTR